MALALLLAGPAEAQTRIRIGWQPTTTVEAQIAHVAAKMDIFESHGLKSESTMFAFGPAVNEGQCRARSM